MSVSTSFCRTVNASEVAKAFDEETRQTISSWTSEGRPRPKLVGFLVGTSDSPSATYAEWTRRACVAVGIDYELRTVGDGTAETADDNAQASVGGSSLGAADLEAAILDANDDDNVNGIMVYYPTGAGQRQDSYIQQVVTREKDVEGLNFSYLFNLYHNIRQLDPRSLSLSLAHSAKEAARLRGATSDDAILVKSILPCTPLAIVKTLEYLSVYNSLLPYGQRAYGRVITVINRSEVVGRPLAALLANDGARVFSVDVGDIQEFSRRPTSKSPAKTTLPHHVVRASRLRLAECLSQSDVVITGVPSTAYKIATADLKDGVIAINFSSDKNFEADIKDKASIYVPAIGKATIAMLQRNLLRLVEYQRILASRAPQKAVAESNAGTGAGT